MFEQGLGFHYQSIRMKSFVSLLFTVIILPALAAQESSTEAMYRLEVGDVVRITVFNEPDLAVEAKIDPDGVIIVPLLGRTRIGGLTVRDAERFLEQQFIDEEYLIQPQVSLNVTVYAGRVFYIFGEVRSPGAKNFPQGVQSLGILEAITMGGDLTQFARRREILLRRPIPGSDQETRITIDLDRILRGDNRGREAAVEVHPGDIIFVPERIF